MKIVLKFKDGFIFVNDMDKAISEGEGINSIFKLDPEGEIEIGKRPTGEKIIKKKKELYSVEFILTENC